MTENVLHQLNSLHRSALADLLSYAANALADGRPIVVAACISGCCCCCCCCRGCGSAKGTFESTHAAAVVAAAGNRSGAILIPAPAPAPAARDNGDGDEPSAAGDTAPPPPSAASAMASTSSSTSAATGRSVGSSDQHRRSRSSYRDEIATVPIAGGAGSGASSPAAPTTTGDCARPATEGSVGRSPSMQTARTRSSLARTKTWTHHTGRQRKTRQTPRMRTSARDEHASQAEAARRVVRSRYRLCSPCS